MMTMIIMVMLVIQSWEAQDQLEVKCQCLSCYPRLCPHLIFSHVDKPWPVGPSMSNIRATRGVMVSNQTATPSIGHPGKVVAKHNRFYAKVSDFSGPGREEKTQAVEDLNIIYGQKGSGKPSTQYKRMANAAKWLRGVARQEQRHVRITSALTQEARALFSMRPCYENESNQAHPLEAHMTFDTILHVATFHR